MRSVQQNVRVRRRRLRGGSLARRLLILQLVIVTMTTAIGAGVTVLTAQRRTQEQERQRALAVALTLAEEPAVARALQAPEPTRTSTLQPLAERIRLRTDVAFVVVMTRQGIRYTHPNTALISRRYSGHIGAAQAGRTLTEVHEGSLGLSVRAVVPVRGRDGEILGLVATGVLQKTVGELLEDQLPGLFALAGIALAVGGALSLVAARRVKRQTLGLEPQEIAGLYQHNDAVLHAIREGVLVTSSEGRLLLANDEARRLLDLPEDPTGRPVHACVPPGPLRELLDSGRTTADEVQLAGERVLLVSQRTAVVDRRPVGSVVTLRDRTELQSLARELDSVRGMADSLRAQAHEAANQLHTVVGLVELGRYEQAVSFATERVAGAQELLHRLQEAVREPALVALIVGKAALARERGVELMVAEDAALPELTASPTELVTVVGNLLDNAFDAAGSGGHVELHLGAEGPMGTIVVADDGPGFSAESAERIFDLGWTTKPSTAPGGRGLGLALVRQVVLGLGGEIGADGSGGARFTVRLPLAAPALTEVA
jgi:two-component system CitB family sensor kinase